MNNVLDFGPRVLFILKKRNQYWNDPAYSSGSFSSGLFNSANLVKEMLVEEGMEAKLVEVVDNNSIDREVYAYKPTHVIIEAIWVVPEKFEILQKLHPKVKWIIRNHSDIPFLATEGCAIDWMFRYLEYKNVIVSSNLRSTNDDFKRMLPEPERSVYLPNYYFPENPLPTRNYDRGSHKYVHIACFGAIRTLKNQLIQAVAALQFAKEINKKLVFHINGGRVENDGNPVLKNIRSLFSHSKDRATLVEHPWLPHKEFLELCLSMDIGMQVSFSETFNIVTADMVSVGTPVVCSSEIGWVNKKHTLILPAHRVWCMLCTERCMRRRFLKTCED